MSGFLDRDRPLPWCRGCGHPHVLAALDEALVAVGHPPERYVLVTDIGCVGLADPHFPTLHTVHALHGRAAALATGMRLGEPASPAAPLKPIVLVGDGGATMGLLHLVHAAQLDADVTVVVHNNLVYGMTGGQHSGFTPEGLRTATTPEGSPLPPLDLRQVLAGAGCGYYARVRAPGPDLAPALAEAIRRPGFACVEALELCPTFAARVGGVTGRELDALVGGQGLAFGVTRRERRAAPPPRGEEADPLTDAVPCDPSLGTLRGTVRVAVAGRAGERVQSAALLAARAAAAAGLHATVRTDNPVTQGRGFSLAEVTLSRDPVAFTGLGRPDLAIAVAPEGLAELGAIDALGARRVVLDEGLSPPAGVAAERRPLRARYGGKEAALGALAEAAEEGAWWRPGAWEATLASAGEGRRAELRAVLAKAAAGGRGSG